MSETSKWSAPSLRGKTVVVQVRNREGSPPVILSDSFLETRGDRLFLVGASQPLRRAAGEWCDGVRRAIGWDAVEEYFLFDSLDEFYTRQAAAISSGAVMNGMPIMEFPANAEGEPVEPSGVSFQPETPLEVGTRVLAFSMDRWWRADVIALEGDDMVRIHYPGWDSSWDVTVPKTELQVDLSASIQAEE